MRLLLYRITRLFVALHTWMALLGQMPKASLNRLRPLDWLSTPLFFTHAFYDLSSDSQVRPLSLSPSPPIISKYYEWYEREI